jgi:hypothetical protein
MVCSAPGLCGCDRCTSNAKCELFAPGSNCVIEQEAFEGKTEKGSLIDLVFGGCFFFRKVAPFMLAFSKDRCN